MRNTTFQFGRACSWACFILLLSVRLESVGRAQVVNGDDYLGGTFVDSLGFDIRYRLFVPNNYDVSRSYPIVTYFHGAGGRGSDNLKQVTAGNTSGATVWAQPAQQAINAAFVLAPQAPTSTSWGFMGGVSSPMRAALELLDQVGTDYNIDLQRQYVTGQSMGGYGTWAALHAQPDRFAAGVPLVGGGDPSLAEDIAHIPQWIFHGDADTVVNVENSRRMVTALTNAGGSPIYTEYPGVGHARFGDRAYGTPELSTWLFSQSTQSVPEPSSFAVVGLGLLAGLVRRRRI